MTIVGLLGDLRRRSISVSTAGDDLRVRAPEGALTSELRTAIKAHKHELVTFLQKIANVELDQPERDHWEACPHIEANSAEGEERPLSFAQQHWFLAQWEPESVSRDDSFFELGGHSLSATQLTARVRDRYQVGLPIRELMTLPTLAAFAQAVEVAQWAAQPELSVASNNQTEEFLI